MINNQKRMLAKSKQASTRDVGFKKSKIDET